MFKSTFCIFAILIGAHSRFALRNPASDNVKSDADFLADNYVANGEPAALGQFPWIVRIMFKYLATGEVAYCSGTLISNYHVLTSADCVKSSKLLIEIKVYLGEYDLENFPVDCVEDKCENNKIVYIDKVIIHDQFDQRTMNNDIAILKLQKRAPTTAYIQPIPLIPFNVDQPSYDNRTLVVAGWGVTSDEFQESNVLQTTKVNLIAKQRCNTIAPLTVPEKHLCAGSLGNSNSCVSAYGGPIMQLYKEKYYLAGLFSFGVSGVKCEESETEYYTNVFQYTEWIKSNM